jgi:hypothetical protein
VDCLTGLHQNDQHLRLRSRSSRYFTFVLISPIMYYPKIFAGLRPIGIARSQEATKNSSGRARGNFSLNRIIARFDVGPVKIYSIGEIIAHIVRARDWFEGIAISTAGTRLECILDRAHKILNTITAQPLGIGHTEEDNYYALTDGIGFGRIAIRMSKLPSHLLPRRTLQDILKGPLAVSDEDAQSNDPRNKFVELELAANLPYAGFKLVGFDDLKFEFEGYRYVIECKRPFCDGNLNDNIEKAYRQLQRKLNNSSDRGIVAVAVEKVFGLDRPIDDLESASDASRFAYSIAQQFMRKVRGYESTWIDHRVVGVVAIIRFILKTKTPDLVGANYMYNYILALVKFATPQSAQPADSIRLDKMAEAFRACCN